MNLNEERKDIKNVKISKLMGLGLKYTQLIFIIL